MKNFRKTIIALATVAAMLVPSVAMAATITAEVDSSVAGNVYAGFYNGGVLQKAVLGGTTTAEAGAGSTEAAPLTKPVVTGKIATYDDAKDIKKLSFMAKAPEVAAIKSAEVIFSYDSSVVVPVNPADGEEIVVAETTGDGPKEPIATYVDGDNKLSLAGMKWVVGNGTIGETGRTAVKISQYSDAAVTIVTEDFEFAGFYFKVKDGQTLKEDTFKIEKDHAEGTFLYEYDYTDAAKAIKLYNPEGVDYYYAWAKGLADTIAWNGFEIVEDVQPKDGKPVVTVADELVSPTTGVHKLVFSVKAPAGTEDAMDTTLKITFDKSISPVDISKGTALAPAVLGNAVMAEKQIGKAITTYEGQFIEDPWNMAFPFSSVTPKWTVGETTYTLEVTAADEMDMYGIPMENKVQFMELYYLASEEVDENTFKFDSASFGTITAVDFAGFPWKAAETTKTLTIENVDLTDVTYDEVVVFVWDDKQIAQCDSLAMTDGEVVVK